MPYVKVSKRRSSGFGQTILICGALLVLAYAVINAEWTLTDSTGQDTRIYQFKRSK